MFLWQMKLPNTQTPWSILTLSRKKTNIPSCLLSKIKEEVISKYQLSPIMRNRLKYLFHNYQIDLTFIPQIYFGFSNTFSRNLLLISGMNRKLISKKRKFLPVPPSTVTVITHKYNFLYLSIPVTKKICLFIV